MEVCSGVGIKMSTELCGYVFMGTDEKRHRCTLPADHRRTGTGNFTDTCWCQDYKIRERPSKFPMRNGGHESASHGAASEEEILQKYIEAELEAITCRSCPEKVPYSSNYCDRCGNKLG